MIAFESTSVSGDWLADRLRFRNENAGLYDFAGGLICLDGGEEGGDMESLEMGSENGFSDGERGEDGVGEGETSLFSKRITLFGFSLTSGAQTYGALSRWDWFLSSMRGTATGKE